MIAGILCALIINISGLDSPPKNSKSKLPIGHADKRTFSSKFTKEFLKTITEEPVGGSLAGVPYDIKKNIMSYFELGCWDIQSVQKSGDIMGLNHCLVEKGLEWIKGLLPEDTYVSKKTLLFKGMPKSTETLGKLHWFDSSLEITEIYDEKVFKIFYKHPDLKNSPLNSIEMFKNIPETEILSLENIESKRFNEMNKFEVHELVHMLLSFLAGLTYTKLKLEPPLMMLLDKTTLIMNSKLFTRSHGPYSEASSEDLKKRIEQAGLLIAFALITLPSTIPELEVVLKSYLDHAHIALEGLDPYLINYGVRYIFHYADSDMNSKRRLLTLLRINDLNSVRMSILTKSGTQRNFLASEVQPILFSVLRILEKIFRVEKYAVYDDWSLFILWFIFFDKTKCVVPEQKLHPGNKFYKLDYDVNAKHYDKETLDKECLLSMSKAGYVKVLNAVSEKIKTISRRHGLTE